MYRFHGWEELAWGVGVAVALVVAQELFIFDPEKITDVNKWAITIMGASVRAAGGALLAWLGARVAKRQEPVPAPPVERHAEIAEWAERARSEGMGTWYPPSPDATPPPALRSGGGSTPNGGAA